MAGGREAAGDDRTQIESRLQDVGRAFIEAHDDAGLAIREAAGAGLSVEEMARASGLSPQTVRAFLR